MLLASGSIDLWELSQLFVSHQYLFLVQCSGFWSCFFLSNFCIAFRHFFKGFPFYAANEWTHCVEQCNYQRLSTGVSGSMKWGPALSRFMHLTITINLFLPKVLRQYGMHVTPRLKVNLSRWFWCLETCLSGMKILFLNGSWLFAVIGQWKPWMAQWWKWALGILVSVAIKEHSISKVIALGSCFRTTELESLLMTSRV